jgi:TP901 family phage tail tape measure protein
MADVQSNINVNIDTSDALASLKLLQRQISAFHSQMSKSGAAASAVSANQAQNLMNSINATGKFQASMRSVKTSTESFTDALEKNKLTSREYFRYTGAATKTFGRLFKSEFETISKVARERVKDVQTQYIKMGRGANGALQAIAVRPLTLDMKNLGTQTAMAAQKQQILNQLLKQGSTNLLNFGKNTQWAGRQLMVGFTVPLAMVGSAAAKTFMAMEEQAIRFRRVYGDMFTTKEQTDKMVADIQTLAKEYTKYGIAVAETMEMAASAAAMGKVGADLTAQVSQATRLAVLGGVEQAEALETTISITNAFGVATEDLTKKIDFLNAVENQTVVSIEDLTIAIPKAGPVVQQLGGDVEDLAFFLTAMKEGGINASEGANALKSGLASLINPSAKASAFLGDLGVNIKGIVEANKGDVRSTVVEFSRALDTLDPLNRARAIEQLFGKFQFSRLSTLFQNVVAEGSQASKVLELTKASTEELAILSERELSKIEDTTTYKFKKSIEDLKVTLAPVGEQFLKALTPIVEFASKILDKFNGLGDGTKKFITIFTVAVAGIGPILLMSFGLIANAIANIIKLFANMRGGFQKIGSSSQVLGEQTNYLTQEQLEASSVAASLDQVHQRLKQTFTSEATTINALTTAYQRAIAAQRAFGMPTGMRPGVAPKKFAEGGIIAGPGGPTSDSVPIMASNGEAIISAKVVDKYPGLVQGLIAGNIPGYKKAGIVGQSKSVNLAGQAFGLSGGSQGTIRAIQSKIDASIGQIDDLIGQALTNLASETELTVKKFRNEVRKLAQAQGKTVASLGPAFASNSEKRVGGGGAYSAPKSLGSPAEQLRRERGKTAAAAEMAPARAAAKAIRQTMEKHGATPAQIKSATQIDRSHTVAVSKEQKGVKSGVKTGMKNPAWSSNVWTPQTGAENNSILESLKKSEKYRKLYQEYLVKTGATETQITSIMSNINKGVALTEEQLSIQGRALRQIAVDAKTNASIEKQTSRNFVMYADAVGQGALAREKVLARQPKKLRDLTIRNQKAIQAIADELPNSAALALQTQSPSRKMRKVGQDAGAGLVLGAQEYIDDARATGQKLGAATVQGTQSQAAASRTRLYGTGPIDANQKSIRRQLQAQQKRSALAQKSAYPASVITAGGADSAKKQTLSSRVSSYSQKLKDRRAERKESGTGMGAGGKMMAASGLMMGASMIPGAVGDAAQKLMMPMMALSMIMPLLTSGVGIAVVAFGAMAGAIYYFNQSIKKARQAGIDLAKSMTMTSEKLQSLSEITGKVSATEEADRKRQNILTGESGVQRKFGQNILGSEFGQTLLGDIKKQAESGQGIQQIGTNVSNSLAYAIVQGIITTDQARSISAALGEELKSYEIPAIISGKLTTLFGPNGENLAKDPLSITLAIQKESMDRQTDYFKTALEASVSTVTFTNIGQVIGGGVLAAAGLITTALAGWTGAGAVAGVAMTGVGAANVASGVSDQNKRSQLNNKLGAAAIQLGLEQITMNNGLVDSLNKQYDTKVAMAKTDKEIKAIEEERAAALVTLNGKNAEALNLLIAQKDTFGPDVFTNGINAAVDALYKEGPMKVFADEAKKSLNSIADADFKAMLQIEFASGSLDPITVTKLANNQEMQSSFKALVDVQGSENANLILQLLMKAAISDTNIPIFMDILKEDPENFDKNLDAITQLANMKQKYGITINLNDDGVIQLKEVSAITEKLKATKDSELSKKAFFALGITGDMTGKEADDLWKTLVGTSNTINKQVTIDFVAAGDFAVMQAYATRMGIGTPLNIMRPDLLAKLKVKAAADLVGRQGKLNPNPCPPGQKMGTNGQCVSSTPVNTTKKEIASSPLDDIVKKLKDVRKNQIDVTKGWAASAAALKKLFGGKKSIGIFSGIENDLRNLGAGEDLIDLITGMTKEEYEREKKNLFEFDADGNIIKIKDDAQSIQDGLASVKLGQFVSDQQKMAKQIGNQVTALNRLKAAGIQGSVALEAVADATFAAAIANKDLDDKQILDIAAAWRIATKEKRNYAAIEGLESEEASLDNEIEILKKLTELMGMFTKEQMNAIMQSEALKKALVGLTSFKPGDAGYEQFFRILRKMLEKEKIQLNLDKNSIEGMQKIFDQGFATAMERVDVEEKGLTLKFEADTFEFQKQIDEAQDKIDKAQFDIDDKEAALKAIEKQEQKINDKYDERIKALDEVEKANASISAQQKGQLSLAEALTSGDIAAAARAAQEMRAKAAEDAVTKERDALEKSRENELKKVTSGGKTRKDLEKEIQELEDYIADLEEKDVEPAQEEIRKKNVALRDQIKELDKVRRTWEGYQQAIDKARVNNRVAQKAIDDAIEVMPRLIKAYEDQCPDGMILENGICVPIPVPDPDPVVPAGGCDPGFHDDGTGNCVPDVVTDPVEECPEGYFKNSEGKCYKKSEEGSPTPALTYCPSLGRQVPTSGFPKNCPGAGPGPTPTPTPAPTPTKKTCATGETLVNGKCVKKPTLAELQNKDPMFVSSALHREELARIAADNKKNQMLFQQNMNVRDVTKNAGSTPGMHLDSLYKGQNAAVTANALKMTPGMIAQEKAVKDAAARAAKAAAEKKAKDAATLKSFGGNAAAANAFGNWPIKKSMGGLIPKYFERGGFAGLGGAGALKFTMGSFARGTDTVPAMLTPGEFIMSKYAVDSYGVDTMKKINNGDSIGGTVYNNTYTLTVNAKTDANPRDIAQAVMSTIRNVDDRRIRGVSLNGR